MNQLTDTTELAKKAGITLDSTKTYCKGDYWAATKSELEAFRSLVIEAEHKRLLGVGVEPVELSGSYKKWHTPDQLAAAVARKELEWGDYSKAMEQIFTETQNDLLSRNKVNMQRIAELEANLKRATAAMAESGYSACDMATAAAQGFRDGMSQSK